MRRASGVQIIEIVIAAAIVAIVFAALMPIFIRDKCNSHNHQCQCNLNQIGKALKMYMSDWDGFPVNGAWNIYASAVYLSDPSKVDADGDVVRFQHGTNWVEALMPYVEKVWEGDAYWAWTCPVVYRPSRSAKPIWRTTYAFNANLAGQPEKVVRNAGAMMMVRELGQPEHAVLRPTAPSPSEKTPPNDTFLDADELSTGPTYKLHGDGSHILFADGHVKGFGMTYFPKTCEWDSVDKQWYNYVTLPEGDPRNKSIAVSP